MSKYRSKPNLNKVVKTVDLFAIVEAAGLDENSPFFEYELKFGVLVDDQQYEKVPEPLRKHFKKVEE